MLENCQIRYLHSSDRALSVEFGNEISETIHNQIRAFCHLLKERRIPGITEIVPTYRSVMVHYEPDVIFYDALIAALEELVQQIRDIRLPAGEIVEVPVYYGGASGPDLATVAAHNGLSESEVIRLHCSAPLSYLYAGLHARLCLYGRHGCAHRHAAALGAPGEAAGGVRWHCGKPDGHLSPGIPRRMADHWPDASGPL